MLKSKKPASQPENILPNDVQSFGLLFERHQTELIRYLYGLVGETETALDLTQETFVRGYQWWLQKPKPTADSIEWRPLLYKIATNCALDVLRRQKTVRFTPLIETGEPEHTTFENDQTTGFADPASQTEMRLAITATLGNLDSAAATCLLLYYDQGFSCNEIALITGSSVSAVWQRLSRARRLFCNLYQKEQAQDV